MIFDIFPILLEKDTCILTPFLKYVIQTEKKRREREIERGGKRKGREGRKGRGVSQVFSFM